MNNNHLNQTPGFEESSVIFLLTKKGTISNWLLWFLVHSSLNINNHFHKVVVRNIHGNCKFLTELVKQFLEFFNREYLNKGSDTFFFNHFNDYCLMGGQFVSLASRMFQKILKFSWHIIFTKYIIDSNLFTHKKDICLRD
jgi:hypothetical protein